jgi:arylsulfatase A-like enzyme
VPLRPNILFIQTDQQMAATLGCYGSTICRTPNIDALARDGLLFTNAYASSPVCAPARASLHTGYYPSKHGITTNIYTPGCAVHELPDHPSLLGRRLQQLGYQAGFTGKWHLGFGDDRCDHPEYQSHVAAMPVLDWTDAPGALPSTRGFSGDDFPGHGGIGLGTPQYREWLRARGKELTLEKHLDPYPHNWEITSGQDTSVTYFLTENALKHMEDFVQDGRPFCYLLNYWGPHGPYCAPTEYLDLYRDTKIPPWPSWNEEQSNKPTIHDAHRTETTLGWQWEDYEKLLRTYFAAITEIDDMAGKLVRFLKDRSLYDNTLIVFCADHGDSLGVHGGLTDKTLFMYEETNRIPLIIKESAPVHRAGQTESAFVGTCDLYSTILDYAGLPAREADRDGTSLRPLIAGTAKHWRDSIVTEGFGLDFLQHSQRALRWRNFKYVFNAGGPDELYDLSSDPHEMHNLVFDPSRTDLLREAREKLDAWMTAHRDGLRERFHRLRLLDRSKQSATD